MKPYARMGNEWEDTELHNGERISQDTLVGRLKMDKRLDRYSGD